MRIDWLWYEARERGAMEMFFESWLHADRDTVCCTEGSVDYFYIKKGRSKCMVCYCSAMNRMMYSSMGQSNSRNSCL